MPKLPILPLPHPTILLPGVSVSVPLNVDLGQHLAAYVQESSGPAVVAAVPIISPNSSEGETPVLNDWGCAARVTRLLRPSALDETEKYIVTLHGLTRVRLAKPLKYKSKKAEDLMSHPVEYPPKESAPGVEVVRAFKAAAFKLLDRLVQDAGRGSRRAGWTRLATMVEEASENRLTWLADIMIWSIVSEYEDRLAYLAEHKTDERLMRAADLFLKQITVTEVSKKIANAVDESLTKQQKEFFLRQQLAAIQRELAVLERGNGGSGPIDGAQGDLDGEDAASEDDLAEVKRRIEAMERGSEERKMAVREWRRLKRIPQQSADHAVVRNYLEWLTALPWPMENAQPSESAKAMRNRSFISRAKEQLDADHYGLDKIKRRLVEFLAVIRLHQLAADAELKAEEAQREAEGAEQSKALIVKSDKGAENSGDSPPPLVPHIPPRKRSRNAVKGPILLFVGPPGTGKTSLGQSIARALDRPFQRISLGGVRDEAEIRGHRRTYVGSGPGLIAQALRKAGRLDPVLLLDEIDKVGPSNYHGDVGSALLEVLDPEQNFSFNDHYINVPIDLSQVLFICTANTLDTISAPLLDRCEIVALAGYTHAEKTHIARRFLLPKQLRANALDEARLEISDAVLTSIVTNYTREAGVRSLERAIGAVVRAKAVAWSEAVDTGKEGDYNTKVEESDLEAILGVARWDGEEKEREARRGVVYGLVVMGLGEGGILPVETTAVPGTGQLKLTGSLGEVIKESGELALSWVKTHAYMLNITITPAQDPLKFPDPIDVHLHLPAGAQKKDGPSAGVAMTCAFVSLLTGAVVPSNVAMTGEITLRGRVTPVGGIKEKILGAHRASITKVILPLSNRKDVEHDVPPDVRASLDLVFVRTVEEALDAAFGKDVLEWRIGARASKSGTLLVESRL
ncbi:ATP-dependent protease La [Fomitiporia mediterranea MF3/22]|uniref:ATP-dependent protease La n=1 Tax=Fomitiporia mediterranea (strain MF3/22) TaxID=694068 RepID=UPI0004409258|nr:ATP-dependent protease La [Fomitiporia mediterranea MF3/22]EJD04952.1 ATP-dependent protease La [Fomitiporia mediterranea MF3/22]